MENLYTGVYWLVFLGATQWSSSNTVASRKRDLGLNPGCGEMLSAREDWESTCVWLTLQIQISTHNPAVGSNMHMPCEFGAAGSMSFSG